MTTLKDRSSAIWAAVQDQITQAVRSDGSLAAVKDFVPRRKLRAVQQRGPALHVIARTAQVIE